MKKLLQMGSILGVFYLTGCAPSMLNLLDQNLDNNTKKTIVFKTNHLHFMTSLKDNASLNERNAYLDEFILKSDVQCQNYLNNPLKKPDVDKNKDSLYMSLFDTVSGFFGMGLVTNTAKAVFLNNGAQSEEDKKAYANALSPEIRKGVELGRSRYARSMVQKKNLSLKDYSVNNLREDSLKYDKQCNDVYGLIEINRALKEMQNAVHTRSPVSTPTLKIDPKIIKEKVIAVTKEVEEKKVEKKKIKTQE